MSGTGASAERGVLVRAASTTDDALVARLRVRFLADVRDLQGDDVSTVVRDATAEYVTRSHASGALRSWLAEDDGEPVGLVSLIATEVPPTPSDARPFDGYVINLWVSPDRRSQGVGRMLLDTVVAHGRTHGFRRINLLATEAGHPLYASAGFATNPDVVELHLPR